MNYVVFLAAFLITVLSSGPSFATRYWASVAGGLSGGGSCATASGTSDPGSYYTPTALISAGCVTSGDETMFKNGTYTTAFDASSLLPSGTSSTYTKVLCESSRGCIIRFNNPVAANAFGQFTVPTSGSTNRNFIQVGDENNGFDFDGVNCAGQQCKGVFFRNVGTTNAQGAKIIGNRMRNQFSDGIELNQNTTTNAAYTDVLIQFNKIESASSPTYQAQGPPHGIYLKTQGNALVTQNDVTSPGQNSAAGQFGMQCYFPCNGATFTKNLVRVQDGDDGMIFSGGPALGGGNVSAFNVFTRVSGTTSICLRIDNSNISNKYYNNLCHGFGTFIYTGSAAGTTELKNNICVTGFACGTTRNGSSVITTATNLTGVATSNFTSAGTFDYSLVAGAVTLIDQGTSVGFPCNGACEIGPFETFSFSSCSVEAAGTSAILVTFMTNAFPPLLPSSGATTFTARRNGSNNALTGAVTRPGGGILSLPVTTPYAAGNTVDISLTAPNITDSIRLGNLFNQPYLGTLTNQSCTNNAGGASYFFTQDSYEFHYVTGSEASPVIIPYGFGSAGAAENYVGLQIGQGGAFRIRIAIICGGADCPPTAFNLYRSTGGGYTPLTDSFGTNGGFKYCGNLGPSEPADGSATTTQMSVAGSRAVGSIYYSATALSLVTGFTVGKVVELEFCVDVRDTAAVDGIVDLRVRTQDGIAFDAAGGAYTRTPRITVSNPAHGGSGM